MMRDYIAAWVSRRLLSVGLNLGELPACLAKSAECGAELFAGRDPALKKWSGPRESFEMWRWLLRISQAKLSAKAKLLGEARAAADEQKAKLTQMASISKGQSLALLEPRSAMLAWESLARLEPVSATPRQTAESRSPQASLAQ